MKCKNRILHTHYKALVTKAEAKKFWALRPAATPTNVIPLPKTG